MDLDPRGTYERAWTVIIVGMIATGPEAIIEALGLKFGSSPKHNPNLKTMRIMHSLLIMPNGALAEDCQQVQETKVGRTPAFCSLSSPKLAKHAFCQIAFEIVRNLEGEVFGGFDTIGWGEVL